MNEGGTMFNRLKKHDLSPEMIERKKEAEKLQKEAERELQEAQEIAKALQTIRLRNHFAEGFRKSLGGTGGT